MLWDTLDRDRAYLLRNADFTQMCCVAAAVHLLTAEALVCLAWGGTR